LRFAFLLTYLLGGMLFGVYADRTRNRKLTYFDGSAETPLKGVCYIPMARPYSSHLREVACSLPLGSDLKSVPVSLILPT